MTPYSIKRPLPLSALRKSSFILYVVVAVLTARYGTGGNLIDTMRFEPCPASPNCVSSQSHHPKRHVEPLLYAGGRPEARQKLIDFLLDQKRVEITDSREDYLRAEFRSLIFRFVDDVEFYFPSDPKVIHVRSASRSGYYDFGVNRRRIERIRKHFGHK
jgi:uncharacterized protein (DUF1499 family)